jgi:hypothetical protein
LKEGCYINKSLLVLGNVINTLAEKLTNFNIKLSFNESDTDKIIRLLKDNRRFKQQDFGEVRRKRKCLSI